MLHRVKIAMGGTRVFKNTAVFGGKFTPVGGRRVSKYVFWRDIQSHIVYVNIVHNVSQTTE